MKPRTVSGFGGAALAVIVVVGALVAVLALATQDGGHSLGGAPTRAAAPAEVCPTPVPESSYLPDLSSQTLSPKEDAERREERDFKISVWQHIAQQEIELCELRNRVAALEG